MERVVDETGWNQKRYDIRTYTAQNERSRRIGTAGEIPDEYIYIGEDLRETDDFEKWFFHIIWNGLEHSVIGNAVI